MFSKLLKYDNKAIFKYWWIAAVGSVLVSLFGGLCIQVVDTPANAIVHQFLYTLASIGLMFSIFGLFLLPLITQILILVRFYKNFFTDEGYLTFTLPVKKTTLLNSKLVMTLIFSLASTVLLFVNIFIMLAVGMPEDVFAVHTWNTIGGALSVFFEGFGGFGVSYIILVILIFIALMMAQMLFIFLCITIAAVIAKKHKVLTAIALYYGINMVLSFGIELMLIGGIFSVADYIASLGVTSGLIGVAFIMLAVLGLIITAGMGLYLVQLRLLDKKLNLE